MPQELWSSQEIFCNTQDNLQLIERMLTLTNFSDVNSSSSYSNFSSLVIDFDTLVLWNVLLRLCYIIKIALMLPIIFPYSIFTVKVYKILFFFPNLLRLLIRNILFLILKHHFSHSVKKSSFLLNVKGFSFDASRSDEKSKMGQSTGRSKLLSHPPRFKKLNLQLIPLWKLQNEAFDPLCVISLSHLVWWTHLTQFPYVYVCVCAGLIDVPTSASASASSECTSLCILLSICIIRTGTYGSGQRTCRSQDCARDITFSERKKERFVLRSRYVGCILGF